jgi:hypothetical protein
VLTVSKRRGPKQATTLNPKPSPPKRPALSDAEEERKQQRWAATSNLITGILLFDRHKPGDGFEMAAAYDPDVAASRGEKITPQRIRMEERHRCPL